MKLVSLLTISVFAYAHSTPDKVVCYYQNSNGYSLAKPEDLDADLCTHLNYAFINLGEDGNLKVQNPALDIGLELYKRVNEMKLRNAKLKVLLSVGGTAASVFAKVAANPDSRWNFVNSSRYYLETYGFDGLDVDWETPTSVDKENFILLLTDLKTDFQPDGWLLTAAVSAIPNAGFDIPAISKLLDFVNLMSYDYYGPWSKYTGQNSPLFEAAIESTYEKKYLNVANSAKNWIAAGANPEKLVVGVAFYGRAFTLEDPSIHLLHAPILGAGTLKTPSYRQICSNYNNWTTVWDDEQKNPIKYLDDQWLGYDNMQSVTEKVKHVVKNNYGGIMVWHVGADDIQGVCGGPRQTLLSTINSELKQDANSFGIEVISLLDKVEKHVAYKLV